MMAGEHWGPVEAAWPTPESELEDIELGFRVGWWLLMFDLARRDPFDAMINMISQVAQACEERNVPYPDEWESTAYDDKGRWLLA